MTTFAPGIAGGKPGTASAPANCASARGAFDSFLSCGHACARGRRTRPDPAPRPRAPGHRKGRAARAWTSCDLVAAGQPVRPDARGRRPGPPAESRQAPAAGPASWMACDRPSPAAGPGSPGDDRPSDRRRSTGTVAAVVVGRSRVAPRPSLRFGSRLVGVGACVTRGRSVDCAIPATGDRPMPDSQGLGDRPTGDRVRPARLDRHLCRDSDRPSRAVGVGSLDGSTPDPCSPLMPLITHRSVIRARARDTKTRGADITAPSRELRPGDDRARHDRDRPSPALLGTGSPSSRTAGRPRPTDPWSTQAATDGRTIALCYGSDRRVLVPGAGSPGTGMPADRPTDPALLLPLMTDRLRGETGRPTSLLKSPNRSRPQRA